MNDEDAAAVALPTDNNQKQLKRLNTNPVTCTILEGYLNIKVHLKRRQYCVLHGLDLHLFKSQTEYERRFKKQKEQQQDQPSREASTVVVPSDNQSCRKKSSLKLTSFSTCSSPSLALLKSSRKCLQIVSVKDFNSMNQSTSELLLGCDFERASLSKSESMNGPKQKNGTTFMITTKKTSKIYILQAENTNLKKQWIHAIQQNLQSLFFPGPTPPLRLHVKESEKEILRQLLYQDDFNAHTAITMLQKCQDDGDAVDAIVMRFSDYALLHMNDIEFYLPQIVHLVVHMDVFKSKKLTQFVLSMCKAKGYQDHLRNSIHIALQIFWYLEGMIQDCNPKTYNRCVELLMSVEAKVVDQHFENKNESVETLLNNVPGLREKLFGSLSHAPTMSTTTSSAATCTSTLAASHDHVEAVKDDSSWVAQEETCTHEDENGIARTEDEFRVDEPKSLDDPSGKDAPEDSDSESFSSSTSSTSTSSSDENLSNPVDLTASQRSQLLEWYNDERKKRYLYFQDQRDFVKSLTDLSEKLRLLHPVEKRKDALPLEIDRMIQVPQHAYIPMGKATGPYRRILRILKEEGTVFSTAARAPCLLCLEAIEGDATDDPSWMQSNDNKAKLIKQLTWSLVDENEEITKIIQSKEAFAETIDGATESGEKMADIWSPDLTPWGKTEGEIDQKFKSEDMRRQSIENYNAGLSKMLGTLTFGESWMDKKERIRKSSPHGHLPGWTIISLISKSNDDIRQEVFALQLISKFQEIFHENGLPLWLRPYRIVSTGNSTGLIETITDAQSLDSLKKKKGYTNLREHFEKTYGEASSDAFKEAQAKFLNSLVSYSIVCYLLQIKDRHNGNILIDKEGHLIHIDFGFILGIAPGGNWSIETAPFKLTKEMVHVLDGVQSTTFQRFIHLFSVGMLAAKRNADKLIILIEVLISNSKFPCFQGKDPRRIINGLRQRLAFNMENEQVVDCIIKLTQASYNNKWTKRYDQFQKLTNGILP